MGSHIIDGNNIIEVYTKIEELAKSVRKNPRPILLEFKTFRMRGHEEASGTKYVPQEMLDFWSVKDPLSNFEAFLIKEGILTEKINHQYKEEITSEINEHLQIAFDEEKIIPNLETELNDVFKSFDYQEEKPSKDMIEATRFVIETICALPNIYVESIKGHRDVKATLCPGQYAYKEFSDIFY